MTRALTEVADAHQAAADVDRKLWAAIAAARSRGNSWAAIGQALGGISKQAAQQRFDVLDRRYRGTQLTIAQEG